MPEQKMTSRFVNDGAEKYMNVTIPIHNGGYIKLVDYMGTDETVVAAARHSYGKGVDFNDHDGNERLINFLMRERHTSPFEQPALVFEVKAPIFVFRQWHRHRTGKLNEASARYMELPEETYEPDYARIKAQSSNNKQGSGGELPDKLKDMFLELHRKQNAEAFEMYHLHIENGVAKELARIDLPLSTYSVMVWQMDTHNLLHFLKLRMDSHAQQEVRDYANAIAGVFKESFPKIWAAFEEYVLYAKTFSRSELALLRNMLEGAETTPETQKVLSKLRAAA
jgi:thymidylate synthase (FAD)